MFAPSMIDNDKSRQEPHFGLVCGGLTIICGLRRNKKITQIRRYRPNMYPVQQNLCAKPSPQRRVYRKYQHMALNKQRFYLYAQMAARAGGGSSFRRFRPKCCETLLRTGRAPCAINDFYFKDFVNVESRRAQAGRACAQGAVEAADALTAVTFNHYQSKKWKRHARSTVRQSRHRDWDCIAGPRP